jgi:MFS family permease
MQTSHAPQPRSRDNNVGKLLAAIAAVLWVAVLPLAFWLERNPDAPTGLAIAEFVLALVLVPFTVGATAGVIRRRHSVRFGGLAALLATWTWLVVGVIISLLTRFEFETTYLRTQWPEALLVLIVFGLAGGVMGAAGAVTMLRGIRPGRRGTAACAATSSVQPARLSERVRD